MRYLAQVALLGAASVVWAAVPLAGTGAPGVVLAVVAATCVAAGLLRVACKGARPHEEKLFAGALTALALSAGDLLLRAGWETGAAVSVVLLEATHPARPWHTGLLAASVAGYLLAVHQAESAVPAAVFRGQARALLATLAMVVMTGAVAMVPARAASSAWLEVLAALAAVTAGALALPL